MTQWEQRPAKQVVVEKPEVTVRLIEYPIDEAMALLGLFVEKCHDSDDGVFRRAEGEDD